MSEIVRYNFPTVIHFGVGARRNCAAALQQRNCLRPLLVTDQALAKLPIVEEFSALLRAAGQSLAIYDGVIGNPVKSQVDLGVAAFRAHQSDCIVAFGGGASQDVAKAIALMAAHPGDLFDYEDGLPGARPVDQRLPPLFALPTTAGTGSEVGRSAVVSEDSSHRKKIIFSPRLLPLEVFADPELLVALPAGVTAATGMDAVTHLVEARIARGYQPLCDGIAMEGLRLASLSLSACVDFARAHVAATPEHLLARGQMLNASMMGAVAFQKGLGVTHSLAHALSTVYDLHHGLANGIMIDYAMEFNLPAAKEEFAWMARTVGARRPDAGGFVDWLKELKATVGMPAGLRSHGLDDTRLNELVDVALADGCHPLNPRSVSRADFEELYRKAFAA